MEHAIEQQLRFGEHALLSTETAVPAAAKAFSAACKAAEAGGGEADDAVEAALQQLDLIDFQADKLEGVRAMCLEQQGQDTGAHEEIGAKWLLRCGARHAAPCGPPGVPGRDWRRTGHEGHI